MTTSTHPTVDKLTGLGYDVFVKFRTAYILLNGPLTWQQARQQARSLGGDLVTINNQQENKYITRTFKPLAADPCGLWIGLRRDPQASNRFIWSDGDQSKYRNWVPAGIAGYRKGMLSSDPSRNYVHIYFNPNAIGYWKNSNSTYHDVVLGGGIAEFSLT